MAFSQNPYSSTLNIFPNTSFRFGEMTYYPIQGREKYNDAKFYFDYNLSLNNFKIFKSDINVNLGISPFLYSINMKDNYSAYKYSYFGTNIFLWLEYNNFFFQFGGGVYKKNRAVIYFDLAHESSIFQLIGFGYNYKIDNSRIVQFLFTYQNENIAGAANNYRNEPLQLSIISKYVLPLQSTIKLSMPDSIVWNSKIIFALQFTGLNVNEHLLNKTIKHTNLDFYFNMAKLFGEHSALGINSYVLYEKFSSILPSYQITTLLYCRLYCYRNLFAEASVGYAFNRNAEKYRSTHYGLATGYDFYLSTKCFLESKLLYAYTPIITKNSQDSQLTKSIRLELNMFFIL